MVITEEEALKILSRRAKFEFDPIGNLLYIRIKDGKIVNGKTLTYDVSIYLDENGEIIGIEILDIQGRLDKLIEETSFKK